MRCGVLTPARSLNLTLSLAPLLPLRLTRLPCCELAPGEVACATCAQNHTSAVADVACGAAATRLDDTLTVAYLRAERAAERAALRVVAEAAGEDYSYDYSYYSYSFVEAEASPPPSP